MSARIQNKKTVGENVEHGALAPLGMPNWSKYLKSGDAEAVRAYVGEQARQLAKAPATVQAGSVFVDRER